MKKINLVVAFIILNYIHLFAQPILDSNCLARIGDSITYKEVSSGIQVLPGPSGANVTWDFSNITYYPSLNIGVKFVNPANTSYGSNFPNSNLAKIYSIGQIQYYNKSLDSLTYDGQMLNFEINHYHDPRINLKFPASYQYSFIDNFASNFLQSGNPVSRTGSIITYADAYGTLILPSDTIHDVLRIKMIQFIIDVKTSGTTTYIDTNYFWYNPTIRDYIGHYNVAEFQSNIYSFANFRSDILINGIDDVKLDTRIKLYPNPTSDNLNIEIPFVKNETNTVFIYNTLGNLVKTIFVQKTQNKIDVSDLAKGLYYIKFTNGNVQFSERFVVN